MRQNFPKPVEHDRAFVPRYTFTVFTSTYNRAYTLPRVYQSLCSQTFRDFEWLIIDDGSTDTTRELVAGWQKTADMPIRYLWQENRGRHIAFNRGVQEAQGELFLNLDSDDACVPEALARFKYHWDSIDAHERDQFSAVTGLCRDPAGKLIGDKFPRDVFDSDPLEIQYKYKISGGKWGFQRTDVLRNFPLPTLPGVKFVPEHVVWASIGRHFRTRFINEELLIYYYNEPTRTDQLSTPAIPSAQALAYVTGRRFSLNEEIAWFRYAPARFIWSALQYTRYSFHTGIPLKEQYEKLGNKTARLLWVAMAPLGFLAYGAERMGVGVKLKLLMRSTLSIRGY